MTDKIDCPCGYGKNIPIENPICRFCGTDLSILFNIKNLPELYLKKGKIMSRKRKIDESIKNLKIYIGFNPEDKKIKKKIRDLIKKRSTK
jgi:hypothetical protein